jgi:hypothetical protein
VSKVGHRTGWPPQRIEASTFRHILKEALMNAESSAGESIADKQYLTVVSLDIERFSRFTDAQGARIATLFRNAVQSAFDRTDLAHVYANHKFMQNSGDGIVAGFAQDDLPYIVDRVPSALQGELRELHRSKGLCVRMRMGVSVGPVEHIHDKRVDVAPNRTVIDACRIADAGPTRALLEHSDEGATYLAMAVTPTVMDSTIDRNPLWLQASEFVEVEISLPKKRYRKQAFLHVPSPSGQLLQTGFLGLEATVDESTPPLEERVDVQREVRNDVAGGVSTDGGQSNQVGDVGGDIRDESIKTGHVSGKGAVGGVKGDVRVDNSEDHRGQDRSSRTYVHGDNISANRDANIAKYGRVDDGERHRPSWEKGEQR